MSPWAHGELTVVTAPGPTITAQSRLGEVTAQSRRGHSSVTARSQLSHGEVTAQSRHLQYEHGSVTARSQLNHGPGHGSVTGCDHFGHSELTVSSQWPIFFSWVSYTIWHLNTFEHLKWLLENNLRTLMTRSVYVLVMTAQSIARYIMTREIDTRAPE